MPKILRVDFFKYITDYEWSVLRSIERGLETHEFVSLDQIHRLSNTRQSGQSFVSILKNRLVRNRLVRFQKEGYNLTNLGFDYLALHSLVRANVVFSLCHLIGCGKESDVYLAVADDYVIDAKSSAMLPGKNHKIDYDNNNNNVTHRGKPIAIKFHRLGRISFRKIREKREYHARVAAGRPSSSWHRLCVTAARREYAVMQCLWARGLPTPRPIAASRRAVVMEFLGEGVVPLSRVCAASMMTQQEQNGDANKQEKEEENESTNKQQKDKQLEQNGEEKIHSNDDESDDNDVTDEDDDDDDAIIKEDSGPSRVIGQSVARALFQEASQCLVRIAQLGLVHGDLNEFNLMMQYGGDGDNVDGETNDDATAGDCKKSKGLLRIIDFPQVMSRKHPDAQRIYERDRDGLIDFFSRFTTDLGDLPPEFLDDIEEMESLDVELRVPGYNREREELESESSEEDDNEESDEKEENEESDEEDREDEKRDVEEQDNDDDKNKERHSKVRAGNSDKPTQPTYTKKDEIRKRLMKEAQKREKGRISKQLRHSKHARGEKNAKTKLSAFF